MAFSAEWIGAAIGAWLAVEVIKKVVDQKWARGLKDDERVMLTELYHMHLKTDESGKPLWYVNPKILENQIEVVEEVHKMSKDILELRVTVTQMTLTLKEISVINQQTTKILDRIADRISKGS